ncbi:TPA_asm: hypothetical protein GNB58_004415 [Salmonella enterica subsp. houtenae serovar 45:g,z51:-]|uniref:Lipoprotein n=1 Tax=Salmonella enterica subsp. houtenae serovar 45:g,z51:- TaxID=1967611 RepID=A0A736VC94_SALHO|nr:hypothetical protein [Salmonella enterica subsp. houtenae str. CFSAN000557]HAE7767328.1 hypothetical protein [Salmonella enterica subsp. houtenae serovar 45:g,z51:-]
MTFKKSVFIWMVCSFISGCGLAQRTQINNEYQKQQAEIVHSKAGVQALNYVLEDDKLTANEGGESLCPKGCTFQDVVEKANTCPIGITALYLSIHDYAGQPPSTYKIEDKSVRYSTVADILNKYSLIFGSSALSDPNHVSKVYSDFLKERDYFGLNSISEQDFKQSVGDLYKRRSEIVIKISSMRAQILSKSSQIEKEKAIAQDKANPEMPVVGLGDVFSSKKAPALRDAYSKLSFVTRSPSTNNPMKVYIHVGKYNLTLYRINLSVKEQLSECQRISAYSGYDIEAQCFDQVGRGLSNFAKMVKDPNTPDMTKVAALDEASFGNNYIDFDHAARLAVMHNAMCKKQGDDGYVEMVTVAVPCKNYKGAGMN